jgi:hypothetical protein
MVKSCIIVVNLSIHASMLHTTSTKLDNIIVMKLYIIIVSYNHWHKGCLLIYISCLLLLLSLASTLIVKLHTILVILHVIAPKLSAISTKSASP